MIEEEYEPIFWEDIKPREKCERCNGTGSAARRVPGLLNYIRCNACDGTGIKPERAKVELQGNELADLLNQMFDEQHKRLQAKHKDLNADQ